MTETMTTNEHRSILVVLIAGIGDLVLGSKALRALRNGYPDRRIHLLTSTEAAPLARHYPYVDAVTAFPIRELRKRTACLVDVWKILWALRATTFDTAVNLYPVCSRAGALKMGLLFMMLKARTKVGHDNKGFGCFIDKCAPADMFSGRHRAEAMLETAVLAGGRPDDKGIEVFWDPASEEPWKHVVEPDAAGKRPPVVGINPGGDRANRRWDPARYAAVADGVAEAFGARILLFGGPGEERIAQDIQSRMRHPATDLAGKLNLNELAYVVSRLDLLVTNDSGPMHMAAAVNTPQVAIFGPEEPEHFRPYAPADSYVIMHKPMDCRPCRTAACDHVSCLDKITADEVLAAAKTLLMKRSPSFARMAMEGSAQIRPS